MNNQPAQTEKEQYPVYLDKDREWHSREFPVEQWQIDIFGLSSKVFFLRDGRIGMEYGGRVVVKSIELWMSEKETKA